MHGSTAGRVAKLGWHLLKRPDYLWRYVAANPALGLSPVELGMPWISFPAIDFLGACLTRRHRVFEWGCGGSTVFLASRAAQVVSVEHDPEWHAKVNANLQARRLNNVDLRLAPFEEGSAEKFASSGYLAAVRDKSWDLILVDGILGYGSGGDFGSHRQVCFQLAEKHIKAGGVIVVDDIWMFPELRASHRAKSWREFVGVGPCRYGVTSTAAFFY